MGGIRLAGMVAALVGVALAAAQLQPEWARDLSVEDWDAALRFFLPDRPPADPPLAARPHWRMHPGGPAGPRGPGTWREGWDRRPPHPDRGGFRGRGGPEYRPRDWPRGTDGAADGDGDTGAER